MFVKVNAMNTIIMIFIYSILLSVALAGLGL